MKKTWFRAFSKSNLEKNIWYFLRPQIVLASSYLEEKEKLSFSLQKWLNFRGNTLFCCLFYYCCFCWILLRFSISIILCILINQSGFVKVCCDYFRYRNSLRKLLRRATVTGYHVGRWKQRVKGQRCGV